MPYEISALPLLVTSQARHRWLVRRIPAVGANRVQLAFEHLVAARRKQRVEFLAAKNDVGHTPVWRRQNRVYPSGLIADLDAEPRRHVEPALAIAADAVRARVVESIRRVQPMI